MTTNAFLESVACILSSRLAMYASGAFISGALFLFIGRFYTGGFKVFNSPWPAVVISSIINGGSAVGITLFSSGYHTILPLVLVPLFLTLEMALFIDDDNYVSYIVIGFCAAIHYVAYYDVSAAITQVWQYYAPYSFELGSIAHRNLLFVFANTFCGIVFAWLRFSKIFPNEEFKVLVHNIKKSMSFTLVVGLGTIVLIFTHVLFAPASVTIHDTGIENVLYINTAIKSLFILLSCYIILFSTVLNERASVVTNSLVTKLKEESEFRKSAQRNVLYYYQINTKTDELIETNGFFNSNLMGDIVHHTDFLHKIKFLIHPNDWDLIESLSSFSFIDEDNYEKTGAINQRVRLSPLGLLSLLSDKEINESAINRLKVYDKEYIWTEISTNAACDAKTGDLLLYITLSDVDDKVEMETNLIQAAHTDMLTGLLNRKAAEDIIKKRMLKKENGSLFMLDLDGFKGVNDTLGHPRGDELLIEAADKLRETFRGDDVVCRLGGDEFMIFAVGLSERQSTKARAEAVNNILRIDVPIPDSDDTLKVSASIGIAAFPEDANSFQQLYERADSALYISKEKGKNRYTFYEA